MLNVSGSGPIVGTAANFKIYERKKLALYNGIGAGKRIGPVLTVFTVF